MNSLISSENTLNKELYQLLKSKFPVVKIHNQGQEASGRKLVRGFDLSGGWGECYAVDCPFCNDTKQHLWISHVYGRLMNSRRMYPAICYRRDCLTDFRNAQKLRKIIKYENPRINNVRISPLLLSEVVDVALPEPNLRLDLFDETHPAVSYIKNVRKFDVQWLTNTFDIRVYTGFNPNLEERIIIPISFKGKLIGWTCRAYRDGLEPKYYNMQGFKHSCILFNYDRAVTSNKFVWVVEGPFDVFRVAYTFRAIKNFPVVGLLGSSISSIQVELLKHWKNVYIVLDSDAQDKAIKYASKIPNASVVALSDAKDPDEILLKISEP